jgi:hypothetical protein
MNINYGIKELDFSFYIPSFHANAHVYSCVMKFHPKRFPVLGMIDGEDLERLWSSLGNFSPIVRNMSREARREQLEDGLLGARRRGLNTLKKRLMKKKTKMQALIQIKEEYLNSFRPLS